MTKATKIAIVAISLFFLYTLYVLRPTDELGNFEKIRAAGEINQGVKVKIVRAKGFNKDANSNVIGFYATDINNEEAVIRLQEPAPVEIINADVVEILGHMHGSNFVAKRAMLIE